MQISDGGISDFSISGQSLAKGNCHNSRASYDTDMKLRPAKLNLTRETKQNQKILMMTSYRKIVMSVPFFQFTANSEQLKAGFRMRGLLNLCFH